MIQVLNIDELEQEGYEFDESDRAFITMAISLGTLYFAHDCVVTTSNVPGASISPVNGLIRKVGERE